MRLYSNQQNEYLNFTLEITMMISNTIRMSGQAIHMKHMICNPIFGHRMIAMQFFENKSLNLKRKLHKHWEMCWR